MLIFEQIFHHHRHIEIIDLPGDGACSKALSRAGSFKEYTAIFSAPMVDFTRTPVLNIQAGFFILKSK
jgi:hypothetical protein